MIACCVVVLLSVVNHASAQEARSRVPEPISITELLDYCDDLGLSRSQSNEIERLFDEYREAYRVIQDGEFERALQFIESREGGEWRRFYDRLPGLVTRAKSLDDEFFNEWRNALTDAQQESLHRVRLRRDRARLRNLRIVHETIFTSIPSLTRLVRDLDLSTEQRNAIDQTLFAYEQRMARDLDTLFRRIITLRQSEEPKVEDQERLIDHAQSMRQYNLRSLRNLMPLLPNEAAETLEYEFLARAYAAADRAIRFKTEHAAHWLLQQPELDDAQRVAVRNVRDRARRERDSSLKRAMELIDEDGLILRTDWGTASAMSQEIMDLRKEVREADNDLMAGLADAFGGEEEDHSLYERSQNYIPSYTIGMGIFGRDGLFIIRPSLSTDIPDHMRMREVDTSEDRFIPPRMQYAIVERMLDALDAPEQLRDTVTGLYTRYQDVLARDVVDRRERAVTIEEQVSRQRGNAEETLEKVREMFSARRRSMDRMREAEQAFFRHVRMALENDDDRAIVDRFERRRLIETYSLGTRTRRVYDSPNQLPYVVLSELTDLQDWTEAHKRILLPILDEYETQLLDLLRERQEILLWRAEAGEIPMRFTFQIEDVLSEAQEPDESFQDFFIRLQKQLDHSQQRIARLNDQTLARLRDRLPWETIGPVVEQFEREAFPEVFNDDHALEQHFQRAMELKDLTSEQRGQLVEVMTAYRADYRDIAEAFMDAAREYTADVPERIVIGYRERREQMEQYEKARDRLVDERSILNRRTARRLRTILTEPQLDRIGPLPRPAE